MSDLNIVKFNKILKLLSIEYNNWNVFILFFIIILIKIK